MLFNFSFKWDSPPEFNMGADELRVVCTPTLLGLIIIDDLKWDCHVSDMCSKAMGRVLMLCRMLLLGLDLSIFLDFYYKEIRSILEYGAIVIHEGLTLKLSKAIEKVQRNVMSLLCTYLDLKLTCMESCIFIW